MRKQLWPGRNCCPHTASRELRIEVCSDSISHKSAAPPSVRNQNKRNNIRFESGGDVVQFGASVRPTETYLLVLRSTNPLTPASPDCSPALSETSYNKTNSMKREKHRQLVCFLNIINSYMVIYTVFRSHCRVIVDVNSKRKYESKRAVCSLFTLTNYNNKPLIIIFILHRSSITIWPSYDVIIFCSVLPRQLNQNVQSLPTTLFLSTADHCGQKHPTRAT